MTRSNNTRRSAALVLALGLLQSAAAGPSWANTSGPGSHADYWASPSRCNMWGAPNEGYHVKTLDKGQSWNTQIDGVYNQSIEQDAAPGTASVNRDPADGASGTYPFENNFFCIPDGKYAAGYPGKADLPDDVTTALKRAAAGHADGLPLQRSGDRPAEAVAYNKLAEENDYMFLLFGADWCNTCKAFMPAFAKYYNAMKADGHKFDVVYFSIDQNEDSYNTSYRQMPWKSVGYKQRTLGDDLERIFKRTGIPALAVVDKNGTVLTTEGVSAVRGETISGTYPLPTGASFFDAIEPAKPCPISEDTQISELKKAVREQVGRLSDLTLKYYAKKVTDTDNDGDLPAGDAAVRQYVITKFDEYIDEAAADKQHGRDKITALYGKLQQERNDPANQTFKVGDRMKVLVDFKSDNVNGSTQQDTPATYMGQANIGEVMNVIQDQRKLYTDAIMVKFDDSSFARRWLRADSYKFIEKVTGPTRSQSQY